jgi:hypothetical protein
MIMGFFGSCDVIIMLGDTILMWKLDRESAGA